LYSFLIFTRELKYGEKSILLSITKSSQMSVQKKKYVYFISVFPVYFISVFPDQKKVLIIWFPYVKKEVQMKFVVFWV